MRPYILLFLSAAASAETVHVVCSSLTTLHDGTSCTTTSLTTALTASVTDDKRIILRAGDQFNLSDLTLPANSSRFRVTIESSRYSEFRPGYRVDPVADAAKFATIAMGSGTTIHTSPVIVGATQTITVDPSTDTFTYSGSHGLSNQTEVSFVAPVEGNHLVCFGDNLPLINAAGQPNYDQPCAGRADYFFNRGELNSGYGPARVTEGMPFRVWGRNMPPELTAGEIYYVKNLGGGAAWETRTVNQDSASGGTVLYLTSTSGLRLGYSFVVGKGTAREEIVVANGTATGPTRVNLVSPLQFTHTAVQADGVGCVECMFQVSATSGGAAIDFSVPVAADNNDRAGVYTEWAPQPLQTSTPTNGITYWICEVNSPTNTTFKLAPARPTTGSDCSTGGGPINITSNVPTAGTELVDSNRFASGWGFSRVLPSQNYTWKGIHLTTQSGAVGNSYLLAIGFGAYHPKAMPKNWKFQHLWVGGRENESGPSHAIGFEGDGLEIVDSRCDEVKESVFSDTQCLLSMQGRNMVVRNSLMEAIGENIMFGGGTMFMREGHAENILLDRVHFNKNIKWFWGFDSVATSTTFYLRQRYTSANCDTAAAATRPSLQCFGYTTAGARAVMSNHNVFDGFGSTSGSVAVGLDNSGTWIARYTSALTINCPADFTCTQEAGASIVWPANAVRYFTYPVTSGTVGTRSNQARGWSTKNSIELKTGRNLECVGCVFSNAWEATALILGSQQQGPTMHPNWQNGAGTFITPWSTVQDTLWHKSVWKDIITGFSMVRANSLPSGDVGYLIEWRNFDVGGRHVIKNNLMLRTAAYSRGSYVSETSATAYVNSVVRLDALDSIFEHNTAVDAETASIMMLFTGNAGGTATGPGYRNIFRNNIMVPLKRPVATFPGAVGDTSDGHYCSHVRSPNYRNTGGTFTNNILMNRNGLASPDLGNCATAGIEYPTLTWKTTNGSNDVATLFTSWSQSQVDPDPDTYMMNETSDLRLTDADYKAGGANDATDGRDLGADIDEIEAEAGIYGADTIAGVPPFRVRSARKVVPGTTSITLSYLPLTTGGCTIQGWDNQQYSGVADVDTSDAGATLTAGLRVVTIGSLSSGTRYWFKRRCETGTDVFDVKTR
jgi:hypothetical protein